MVVTISPLCLGDDILAKAIVNDETNKLTDGEPSFEEAMLFITFFPLLGKPYMLDY